MHKNEFLSVIVFISLCILLAACSSPQSQQPQQSGSDVQVTETQSRTITSVEIIPINNCGGKSESKQIATRSFSVNVEGAIGASIGYGILQGSVAAKYGQYRSASKTQEFSAPPGTNMEITLKWTEQEWTGILLSSGHSGTYNARAPISLEQVSSRDLGCGAVSQPPTPVIVAPLPTQPRIPPTVVQVPPTSIPSMVFVKREETGGYTTRTYNLTLGSGEIIVGQSYGFNQNTGGCSAFLIKGPGQFTFKVTDGAWLQYRNTSSEQADSLLQGQIDIAINQYQCTSATMKISKMP